MYNVHSSAFCKLPCHGSHPTCHGLNEGAIVSPKDGSVAHAAMQIDDLSPLCILHSDPALAGSDPVWMVRESSPMCVNGKTGGRETHRQLPQPTANLITDVPTGSSNRLFFSLAFRTELPVPRVNRHPAAVVSLAANMPVEPPDLSIQCRREWKEQEISQWERRDHVKL